MAVLTIFLGAFLVFGVQPLVGRTLLPDFGGMASVWVTCLAAFQMLLLVGYFYAHVATKGQRRFYVLHLMLLLVATVWLILVAFKHKELAGWAANLSVPALGALAAVCALVAVPYLLLSANSSLVQVLAGGNYRLYAVSNAGSFLGLLAYPFVFEPFLSIRDQWLVLAGMCMVYLILLGILVLKNGGRTSEELNTTKTDTCCHGEKVLRHATILWLVLPGATCFLLNAITSHLTSNVAPVPLMWVVLLGLFLLSYVVGFAKVGERLLPLWLGLAFVATAFAAWAFGAGADTRQRFLFNVIAVPLLLFFGCTALHAWLCHLRPGSKQLTRYYLFLALGGAIGGLFSSVAAPLVFSNAREYPLALILTAALVLVAPFLCWSERITTLPYARTGAVGLFCIVALTIMFGQSKIRAGVLAEGRSFYGTWNVSKQFIFNQYGKRYDMYAFTHGGTMHGLQAVDDAYRAEPTTYYGRNTAGLAFDLARNGDTNRTIRASIIGLGVGTMAVYGQIGDFIRFYEICPQVSRVAQEGAWFDFLKRGHGEVEVVTDDARKALLSEDAAHEEKWDMLAVDAYSGDSIPMHLITAEAFDLYARRLKEGGVLALHISNWNLDLLPVVKAAAKHLGWNLSVVFTQPTLFTTNAQWAYLSSRNLSYPDGTYRLNMNEVRDVELPTDAKGSLLPFISFDFN